MQFTKELKKDIEAAYKKLDIGAKRLELTSLQEQSLQPDFWNDNAQAQQVSRQIAKLDKLVTPWQNAMQEAAELDELSDLGEDVSGQVELLAKQFDRLKGQLRFNGPYDSHDAVLTIQAGAGGTDAQDWAQMLLRMYTRWCEQHDLSVELMSESRGEEAGIKSVSISIAGGQHTYGHLKSEHGVHRLVRLSPFNSDNLRQTSFAKVEIMPLIDSPSEVDIDDKDLKIDTYRSSGNGGQSVNTTDSAVRVTHIPTNIVVAIQNEKSQLQNKETALKILRSRLAQLQLEQHAQKLSDLKGPNQANEWGSQIRNYVLHPYKLVKDVRTGHESADPDKVLDGALDAFMDSFLNQSLSSS